MNKFEMMNKYLLIVPAFSTMMLTSCITDNGLCLPEPDYSDGITLNLNISTGSSTPLSRVGESTPDGGINAENYIGIEKLDYCVYILDDEQRIIQRYEPTTTMITKEGNRYVYKMSGKFMPATHKFQVMVMANWKNDPFKGDYSENISLEATTLDDLYRNDYRQHYTFSLYPESDEDSQSSESWGPATGVSGIPMFGLSAVLDTRDSKLSVMDDIEIPMLRALAKIEVENAAAENFITIEECRLTKYNREGRFIPDGKANPDWNKQQKQVDSPTVPLYKKTSENPLTFIKSEDGKTFTAYVPEMKLEKESRPQVEVDVDINGYKETYKIEFANYDDTGKSLQDDENLYSALLRNHRYKFTVTAVGVEGDLDIKTKEDGWDDGSDETFVFEDVSSLTASDINFLWSPPLEGESGNIISITNEQDIQGLFNMKKPTDGSWKLYFAPVSESGELTRTDDESSFLIQLWNYETQNWDDAKPSVGGKIKGNKGKEDNADEKPVKFKIKAKGENHTGSPLRSRLVLTATTIEDVTVFIKLTSNNETNKAKDEFYYIITQRPNED